MEQALRREFGDLVTWPNPKGGFFLWLTLPREIDADRMLERAIDNGVIYVAGEAFYVNALRQSEPNGGTGKNTMRLCFSAPTAERIEAGVARLATTLRGEMAAVATAAGAAGRGAS
jgi:2-aminoadipate transaminase